MYIKILELAGNYEMGDTLSVTLWVSFLEFLTFQDILSTNTLNIKKILKVLFVFVLTILF